MILIIGYGIFTLTHDDTTITAHEECINNSYEAYLVITIHDSSGNIINSTMGKLQIELINETIPGRATLGHSYIDYPIKDGKAIIPEYTTSDYIDVKYNGGYWNILLLI